MNFIDAVKTCYTKKYLKLEGRSSRPEFWYFVLFYYAVIVLIILVDVYFLNVSTNEFSADPDAFSELGIYLIFGFAIASLPPYIGVTVRRLHDINQSGLWVGAAFGLAFVSVVLPFAGMAGSIINIIILIMCIQSGSKKSNKFGKS